MHAINGVVQRGGIDGLLQRATARAADFVGKRRDVNHVRRAPRRGGEKSENGRGNRRPANEPTWIYPSMKVHVCNSHGRSRNSALVAVVQCSPRLSPIVPNASMLATSIGPQSFLH